MLAGQRLRSAATATVLLALLLGLTSLGAFAGDILEVIDATAMGTNTQIGEILNLKILIGNYSTKEDKKILDDAFAKGQSEGLVNALSKMKSVGRIQIIGRLGYDIAYLSVTPTPDGRVVEFVTNRKIQIRETEENTRSQSYNLTGGCIVINDKNPNQSTGQLYPAAQYAIDRDGNMEIQLYRDAWRLTNIIVRKVGQKK